MVTTTHPSLEQQIASLASQVVDPETATRYDYLNNPPLQKWVGQFVRCAPTMDVVTETVLRSIGVSEPYNVIGDYIEERELAFMDCLRRPFMKHDKIGVTIDASAPVRLAFDNMKVAFSKIHGDSYDGKLEQAMKFSFWLIEQANISD